MYFEGKKYACDACVRGHRVSGCNHNDRPLQEIAKKGRPVSQCQHCRTMRKSRAAHVKCDCGDKAKGPVKHHYINENGKLVEMPEPAETSEAKENSGPCRCSSGASRCVCSIKKEILDAVPELAATPRSAGPKKPTLQATHSETSLTKFANGHHRPIHRHNSHHGSAPYHIPHHGTHGGSAMLAELLSEAERPVNQAVRSMTSDAIPTAIALQQPPTRLVKSEHNSPGLKPLTFAQSANVSGTTTPIKDQMSPASLLRSISDFNLSSAGLRSPPDLSLRTDFPAFETADYPSQEYFMSAASEYPVPPNTAVWPSDQHHHHFESLFEMPPDLTQSLSGDDSEVGDFGLSAGLSPVHNLSPGILSGGPLSPESSEVCDSDGYGISAQSSILNMSSLALPPTGNEMPNMENYLGGNPLDYGAFDPNALGGPTDDGKASGLNSYCNSVRNSLQFQDGEVLMMMPLVPSQNMPKFEFRP